MIRIKEGAAACCIGHRALTMTPDLERKVREVCEKLICEENVEVFFFGSKSDFNSLCYAEVSKLREKYPYIKRIFVRAEFPEINEDYRNYLLERYEDSYYPPEIQNAGRAAYLERNYHMIDQSNFCIFYYRERELPQKRKSGTKLALAYAVKKIKKVILI